MPSNPRTTRGTKTNEKEGNDKMRQTEKTNKTTSLKRQTNINEISNMRLNSPRG